MQSPITNIVYSPPGSGSPVPSTGSEPGRGGVSDLPKKTRGRPTLGKPVPVVMNEEERAIAFRLGDGHIAAGVRKALRIADAQKEAANLETKSSEDQKNE